MDVGNGKYNLMILCWGPGMASRYVNWDLSSYNIHFTKFSVHDHTDAHCFVKILDGELTETKYAWPRKRHVPLDISENKTYGMNGVSYMNGKIFENT